MQRYSTIRIGEEIYILKGKDDKVMRSKSNPSYCSLSVNGIYFLNRGFMFGNNIFNLFLTTSNLSIIQRISNFIIIFFSIFFFLLKDIIDIEFIQELYRFEYIFHNSLPIRVMYYSFVFYDKRI
mgnify:CR=1 FL=1